MSKRIGYIRVSSLDQNYERQLEGIELDKCFTDQASGKDTKRPQLALMLNYVRDEDLIIVHSMDRLARNLDDLRKIVRGLTDKKIKIEFLKEKLIFTGEEDSMSNLLLSVMGAFAEFERSLIRERQREGIAIAKTKGKYKGRKPSLSQEQVIELKEKVANGESKTKVAAFFKISRETLYQYLRKS